MSAGGGPSLLVAVVTGVPALLLAAFIGMWALAAVLVLAVVVGCSAVVQSVRSGRH